MRTRKMRGHSNLQRYIYRRLVTLFNDAAVVKREIAQTSIVRLRFPFGTRRWYRRISDELHCRRSAAVDTVYKPRPKLAICFAHTIEHFRRTLPRNARPPLSDPENRRYDIFVRSKFPRESHVCGRQI